MLSDANDLGTSEMVLAAALAGRTSTAHVDLEVSAIRTVSGANLEEVYNDSRYHVTARKLANSYAPQLRPPARHHVML